jgi:molybdopterin-containing oxidoreductase family iron-sulfur binding subunit
MGMTGAGVLLAGCEPGPTKMFSKIVPTDDNVLPGDALLLPTTCTECPAACGVIAKIRNGHPVKLEGNPAHPFNRGALCVRGQSAISRLYLPDRIKTPLMKNPDGKFVEITWDAAFARINAEMAGSKNHLFLSSRTTGALSKLVDEFCQKRHVTRLPEYEFYSHSATRKANEQVFGTSVIPAYNVKDADVLVTVGADIVETFLNPVQFTQDLVANEHLRWFHLEPHFSLTGNFADERMTVRAVSEPYFLQALLGEISADEAAKQTGLKTEQIEAVAAALKKAHAPLLIVGGVTNDLASAVLAAKLQVKFGMDGKTLNFANGYDYSRVGSPADLATTEKTLRDGNVGVLFVNSADPAAYRKSFGDAMTKAAFRVGLGDTQSPTLDNCDIILPLSHSLESWGVEEAQLGMRSVIQPAIKTLHDTRSTGDILLALAGDKRAYKDYIELPSSLVKTGFTAGRGVPPGRTEARGGLGQLALPEVRNGKSLVVVPSLRTFDGRSDDLPVLSEVPDTLSAISFGKFIMVSPDAGAKDKDTITIGFDGGQVQLPVRVQPALPAGVFVVQLPFLKGMTLPVDPQTGEALTVLPVTSVSVSAAAQPLAILSGSMDSEDRGVQPKHDHDHDHGHHTHDREATLYKRHEYKEYRWAMAIDLDRCTGCAACVAACYVENNIPLVGFDSHLAGREMSWIRLEPYTRPDGKLDVVPMMCQHCEAAPCEAVCPVFATYHNPEGLNAQVYNRCVGTRYCANNCPYKVRRFNWLDHPLEKPAELMTNPDVSRRPAGVMEKCTFCIQRITKAKDHAKDEKRLVRDGEVVPACAQTCPGQAITFGNILDKNSRVYAKSQHDSVYRSLEDLGTKPAVYYLKAGSMKHEG